MSAWLQRVENEIQQRNLFSRGQRMLVAVSGGVDSLVLLYTLKALAPKNRWQISVAHFNHQLRGRASMADERWVRTLAGRWGLPFYAGRAAVKTFAATANLSVEMAARRLRHEFLAHTAREQKLPTIVLAHQADDQVELFFLRVLRGAGSEGLAGMKWRSPSPVDKTISLARPLLGCSKAEILAFARAQKIPFREDATNRSHDFLRNRIRNELLPLLQKKYQPGLMKTVLRLMDIVGAESELVGDIVQQTVSGDEGDFDGLPVAVQRRRLQQQLIEAGVTADFELVEQLRDQADTWVSIGAEIVATRNAAGQVNVRRQTTIPDFKPEQCALKLSGKVGRVPFGGRQFDWTLKQSAGPLSRSHRPATEFYDADKVGQEIILRHWRAGDRFQPIGLRSAAKLQDLFVNAKVPALQRRQLVLATTAGGEIFWVEGLRVGEQFKLTSGTKRQLTWKWTNLAV